MKMVLVFLMLFQCHQLSDRFNIVLALLDIIFKHNLKKLLNSLEFLFVQCQGYENYCKIVKGVRKRFEQFPALLQGHQNFLKDHVGVPKLFARCFRSPKTFSTPQKSFPP